MSAAIASLLARFWDGLKDFLSQCWDNTKAIVESWWASLLVVVGWVYFALDWFSGVVVDVVSKIAEISFPSYDPSVPSTILTFCAIANTFFPLDELAGFIVSYLTMVLVLQLYKTAKSWTPFFNGGGA